MKIKIKTRKEYSEQNYLITFIGFLLLPFLIVWVCRIFAPDASVIEIFQAISDIYSQESSWMIPFLILLWLGASIVSLYLYISAKKMPNEKEFDEIDFNEQGISLTKKIDKQKCFLNHPYEDIESFEVDIQTKWVNTSKGGQVLAIVRIDLIFKIISSGKEVRINLFGKIENLYKILNYHKRFKEFKYEISGPTGNLVEQIEFYKSKGKKEIFPENSRPAAYMVAMILFAFAIYMFINMKANIQEQIIFAIAPMIVLAFSLAIFVLLEVDKGTKLQK